MKPRANGGKAQKDKREPWWRSCDAHRNAGQSSSHIALHTSTYRSQRHRRPSGAQFLVEVASKDRSCFHRVPFVEAPSRTRSIKYTANNSLAGADRRTDQTCSRRSALRLRWSRQALHDSKGTERSQHGVGARTPVPGRSARRLPGDTVVLSASFAACSNSRSSHWETPVSPTEPRRAQPTYSSRRLTEHPREGLVAIALRLLVRSASLSILARFDFLSERSTWSRFRSCFSRLLSSVTPRQVWLRPHRMRPP